MTVKVDITVEGLDKITKKLNELGDGSLVQEAMGVWAIKTGQKMQSEPYPPPTPSYKRTGQLGRKWRGEETGKLEVTISNAAINKGTFYAPFVVGPNQAGMHRGRWWQGHEVIVKKHIPELMDQISEKFDKASE